MISILLAKKIFQLFLIMFMGFLAVKTRILKSEDAAIFSKMALYVLGPCAIINCFQIEFTPEIQSGLLLALAAAGLFQLIIILVCAGAKKILRLDKVEHASAIYANSLNLIIPVVASVLGPEWVIYTTAYFTIQTFLFWTHLINLFSGEGLRLIKVITNVNVIAVVVGFCMMIFNIRLPHLIAGTVSDVGTMIGPISMFTIGMLMARVSARDLICSKKIYLVLLVRMIVCPLVILLFLRISGMANLVENGNSILLIPFLAAAAPTANMVSQFASIYDEKASYASAIGTVTQLSCIITMPLLVFLYGM